MLQGPAVDVKSSSPSPGVKNDGSDVKSSPAQRQANLDKTSSVGVSGTDGRTDERSGAEQLSRSSSLPTNVPVCSLPTSVTYLCLNSRASWFPSVFFPHLFQKRSFRDKWLRFFCGSDVLPATQSTMSEH